MCSQRVKLASLRAGKISVGTYPDRRGTLARTVAPGEKELYPAWQGMQYMRNMFDGRAKLEPLDNDRYPSIRWTTARDVLSAHEVS